MESSAAREGSSTKAVGTNPTYSRRSNSSSNSKAQGSHRLREGTLVSDQSGFFREDGDGATFVADSGLEFGALPNLNLERITRLLKSTDEPESIRWSVTGQVTEFSGQNFLLISRAVYKSAATPPVPDQLTPVK